MLIFQTVHIPRVFALTHPPPDNSFSIRETQLSDFNTTQLRSLMFAPVSYVIMKYFSTLPDKRTSHVTEKHYHFTLSLHDTVSYVRMQFLT